jgi:hypothetical protein
MVWLLAFGLTGCDVADDSDSADSPAEVEAGNSGAAPFDFQGETWESQEAWGESNPRCGNELLPGEAEEIDAELVAQGVLPAPGQQMPIMALPLQAGGVINVYAHVIYSPAGVGNIPQAMVDSQIAALNTAYASTGWSFTLVSTDWTQNQSWSKMTPGSAAETAAKAALHQGTADDLNLYTANIGGGLLGWSTFPWDYAANPLQDGVVVLYDSLPGGGAAPYDLGESATHEIGHWMGLFHTFEPGAGANGCAGKGDHVADTPSQKKADYGCPVKDSCPANPGNDPKENFMNYTDDSCMTTFTVGQDDRIDLMYTNFRYGK